MNMPTTAAGYAKVPLKTRRYFSCPACGKHDFSVEHLFAMSKERNQSVNAGPWSCDNCHKKWNLFVTRGDEQIYAKQSSHPETRPMAVLMRLDTVKYGPLFVVLKSQYAGNEAGELTNGDYFFHSHTCPTNYIQDIVHVAIEGDGDPHGLFRLVAARAWGPEVEAVLRGDTDCDADALKRFFETDGEPLPSDWIEEP